MLWWCRDTSVSRHRGVCAKGTLRVMTRDRVGGVPNQPKTPQRSVRIPDQLWLAAKEKAQSRGETVTDVITRALKRYVERS